MHRITRFILIAMFLLLVSISSVFADQEYVVLPGDTLYRIAIRFGVPMSAIAEANNITNYNLIIAGQVLTIPDSSDPTTPTTPPPATDTPTPPSTETYTVQYGDTLGAIARRFNTTVSAIAQENNILNPNLIRVGQVLKIPGTNGGTTPTPTPTPPPDSNPTPTPSPTPNVPSDLTYVVRSGDTLGSIAARFGVSLRDLSTLNRISNPNLIYVGQVLQIPDPLDTDDPVVITPPPAEDTPPPNTVDTSGFVLGGQVLAFDRVSEMNSAGMTWAKRQIHWTQGQPASDFQGVIDEAKSKGFKVLLSVIGQPGQLANNPDQYYQEFAAFLGDLAANGADGIEVWNEMNIDREWPRGLISGTEYTKMLRAAYLAIKDKNTGTLVVSGAPAPTGFFNGCTVNGCDDDLFIRQMAVAGAANYMDCVGIHYNSGITPPSATSGAPVGSSSHYSWYYPSMITLYSNSFVGEPLCFTELGYLTGEGFPPLPAGFSWASGTTLSNQADWLGQAVRMARTQYTNIYLIIVWNVDAQVYDTDPQAGYAIVRPDGSCPACGTLASAMQ